MVSNNPFCQAAYSVLLEPAMAPISNPEPEVIALEGEIDMHESPQVKRKLNPLIDQKTPRILVDLSGVSYIDSSGLAIFIEAMQRIHSYGGKLALFGIQESVRSIFSIARLDQVFKIYVDKDSALAAA